MSFKGTVEARCPSCERGFSAEVWSFVRGDKDEPLREALLAGELNLLLCEHCGNPFYPDASVVYLDARADLLGFIFPESYAEQAARWKRKMRSDWEEMRKVMGDLAFRMAPVCFFGFAAFKEALQAEEDVADELRVAEALCGPLGLELRHVDPVGSRKKGLPPVVPVRRGVKRLTRSGVRKALSALLEANHRLGVFARWASHLDNGGRLPLLGRKQPEAR